MKKSTKLEKAYATDIVLLALVLAATALFFMSLTGCDSEDEPDTCADWLACYDDCRWRELAGWELNACLMDCPPTFVANPLGVPAVEWADAMLERAIEDGDATREDLAELARARGECVQWKR